MAKETKNLNVSHETLRRLAQRATEVIGRHGESDPILSALAVTLGPIANAYMDAYDARHASTPQRQLAVERELASVEKLQDRCMGWVQVIARDLPRFEPVEYSVRSVVAHDVIANARKLVAFVTGYPTTEPALPYAQQIVTELSELMPLAQHDANAAKAGLVTQQQLQNATRNAGAEFYRQLLLFRRVLRRLLGESHRDCQLLNLEREARDEASKLRAAERRTLRAAEKAEAKAAAAAKRAAKKAAREATEQSGIVVTTDIQGEAQPVTPVTPVTPTITPITQPDASTTHLNGMALHHGASNAAEI